MEHYRDNPDFTLRPTFMSDQALAEFLSARPCLNADVVFYNRERQTVYLPTRQSRPADGLWVIGGALKAGELPTDTLVRRVKAETSLIIAPERFEYLGIFSFIWSYRKEAPESDGRHDYNFVHALAITDAELTQATGALHSEEYVLEKGLTAFASVEELQSAGARACLTDYYRLIFPQPEVD